MTTRNDDDGDGCAADHDLPGEAERPQTRVPEKLVMSLLKEGVSRHCPGSCAGVGVESSADRHSERDRGDRWSYDWQKASLHLRPEYA